MNNIKAFSPKKVTKGRLVDKAAKDAPAPTLTNKIGNAQQNNVEKEQKSAKKEKRDAFEFISLWKFFLLNNHY